MKIVPSPPTLLGCAVFTLLIGISTNCFATSTGQPESTENSDTATTGTVAKIVKYTPPKRGAPTTRVGGGTRSSSHALLTLAALAPNHTGYTTSDKPTLYWYLSMPVNIPVEITITTEEVVEPMLELTLDEPIEAGFHALRLTDHDISLQSGIEYQWFVAVVRDPVQRSKDILAGGSIERVDLSNVVQSKLDSSARFDWPSIYAESGFWYDAVAAISRLIESDTHDLKLREQRASLLYQVGLVEAAAYDRGRN